MLEYMLSAEIDLSLEKIMFLKSQYAVRARLTFLYRSAYEED